MAGQDVQHGVVPSSRKDAPAAQTGLAAQMAPQNKTQSNQGILKERWWELLVCRIAERSLAALPVGRVTALEETELYAKIRHSCSALSALERQVGVLGRL